MSTELPRGGLSSAEAQVLRRKLLRWYRRHRRDLPWRRTRDPWRIWVSEVMLQQTQVATALEYYQSFLARFPTLESLARAPLDDVLAQWAGLGYYRRARHLHEAARVVVRDHDGRVPDEPETFGRLPGVGRYTTGAVLSISFDRSLPVLDGNVARVLSRLFAIDAAVRDPRGARLLWARAGALVPPRGAADWNQALMELGARVCTPRAPQCAGCPLRAECRALASGRVGELPPVMARRASQPVRRVVARIARGDRLLMARRNGSLLSGLWEPPGVELQEGEPGGRAIRRALRALGVRARLEPTREVIRHVITHRRIQVEVWAGRLEGRLPRRADLGWIDPARPRVAVTALGKKVGLPLRTRGRAV